MSTQKSFVAQVTDYIIGNYTNNLYEVTLVVPAKRSVRFFTNEFVSYFKQKGETSLLPQIITLNDFQTKLSPHSKLNQTELVFHFYEVYCEIEKNPDSFEQFFTWAPALLSDFNEIDNYLIDPKILFKDLRNIKEQEIEIEGWSFDTNTLSPGQLKLNEFWIKLDFYYHAFKKYLYANGLGYAGSMNRFIAENLDTIFTKSKNQIYIFAGFNALTQCESTIFNYLVANKNAKVFFDTDSYYFENNQHEAGIFSRKNYSDFNGQAVFINNSTLATQKKDICFYESNGEVLQCQQLVKILSKSTPEQRANTAIILCNEQLLPVLINSLTPEWDGINVTMGWPLKFTAANDFFIALVDLNITLERTKNFIPFDTLQNFISASNAFSGEKIICSQPTANRSILLEIYVNSELSKLIQGSFNSINDFIEETLIYCQLKINQHSATAIDLEILAHYIEVFSKIKMLPNFQKHVSSWYLFKQFFNNFSRNYPLAFVGEPLAGVQVMGMLETRGLDFETVFLLSANEGFLPAEINYAGYIPYDLRAHFKLPGKTEQDAVFAYYFYRLLQRSKSFHVFYNSQNELLQQAEKSRYLLQIEKEFLEINSASKFEFTSIDSTLSQLPLKFEVQKSTFYFSALSGLLESGVSSTMLTTACKCQLDFYNKYILGFKTTKVVHELDESGIGNMVHYFFKSIFSEIEGKQITIAFFQNALKNLDQLIGDIIKLEFSKFSFNSGTNYLGLQMVKQMTRSFLERQISLGNQGPLIDKIVVASENSLDSIVKIANYELKIKGQVDLILKDNENNYFVYDFKTGIVYEDNLRLTGGETVSLDLFGRKDKLVQLVFYVQLVKKNYTVNSVNSFIIPLGTGSHSFFEPELVSNTFDNFFNEVLERVIENLFDKDLSIQHIEKNKYCEFCD